MNKHEQNFIKAILAAIIGQALPENIDFEQVAKLARFHGVQGLLFEAMKNAKDAPKTIFESLSQEQMLMLVKDANQEVEALRLMRLFEQREIPVVMLKGWHMKKFYPRPDMRLMADIDMFIREDNEQEIHSFLRNEEYSVVAFGGKKDNIYNKKPFIILEMHKNLFMFEDEWNEFFSNEDSQMYIWNRVEKVEGFDYIYRMDDELFFTYMIAHIAKHLVDDGGIGVKAFLDVWLFLEKSENLDLDVAFRDLSNLGLQDFAKKVIKLTGFWFGAESVDDKTIEEFGDYIISCGIYGNSKVMVATKEGIMASENPSTLKYLFRRAFPTVKAMKIRYPQLKEHILLLPFLYIKRLTYSLIKRTDSVKGEIIKAGEVDYDEVKRIHRLYQNIGLK
ncbi:MAG: nucleotidyltransferase family protein [Ruminococcus sp.]|nr:nucleotidyltransferase family protein [Ruminococcus sp.]